MSCSGIGLEFIQRPYLYERRPLKLSSDSEEIPHSGAIYSQPAFAALTDLRLFTEPNNHPVVTPIKLYINKGEGLTISIEPTPSASGYTSGCVNYVDYIEDIRDLLENTWVVQAADSDHSSNAFKIAQIQRNRQPYGNLVFTSASGTLDDEYVHPNAATSEPTGIELGASGIADIDIDEIAYQPIARPTKGRSLDIQGDDIPIHPFFPRVIKTGGGFPTFGPKDEEFLEPLGLGVSLSGSKLLITGDRLLQDTSVKLMSAGSGSSVVDTGTYSQAIPWALYPAQQELCRYIETSDGSGTVTASGRQALYNIPSASKGVYLTAVSEETETSGLSIQHWPTNWETLAGTDASGNIFRDGLYVEDRLIYDLRNVNPNRLTGGRSIQNGRLVFGHIAGDESNSLGRTIQGGNLAYAHEDNFYSHAGKISLVGNLLFGDPNKGTAVFSAEHTESFAVVDKTFSPVTFVEGRCDDQYSSQGLNSWHPGNTGDGSTFGVLLTYVGWGYIDVFTTTNSPTSTPGPVLETITTVTVTFVEDGMGGFKQQGPPVTTISKFLNFTHSWSMNNFFSFFLSRHGFKGVVRVNGNFYFQYGEPIGSASTANRIGRLFSRPTGFNTTLFPPYNSRTVTVSIGFFPNWKIVKYVSTNNQVVVNTDVGQTSIQILNDASFDKFADDEVSIYGPPVYDDQTGDNYLYVQLEDLTFWFCKMNSDFKIVDAIQVTGTDAILFGPIGIMSL